MGSREIHRHVKNPTLKNIGKEMTRIEDKGIKKGEVYSLHLDGTKSVVNIKAKPTKNQPGNAVVSIDDKAHSWKTLKPALNQHFGNKVKKLENTPVTTSSLKQKSTQAALLTKFEEARRVKEKGYPSRNMIRTGTKKALQQNKASAIPGMYTGPPAKRKAVCKQFSAGATSSRSSGPSSTQRVVARKTTFGTRKRK